MNKLKMGLTYLNNLRLKALVFFRLTDAHDGNLSLTNLVSLAAIYTLVRSPSPSFAEVATLLTAVGASQAKKVINRQAYISKQNSKEALLKEVKDLVDQSSNQQQQAQASLEKRFEDKLGFLKMKIGMK